MESFLQDLRFAFRGLRKHPALTAVAVLSLGLGIGANTTVFTWMEGFVLKPLPAVAGIDRLVSVFTRAPGDGGWSVSWPDFTDWRAGSRTTDLALYRFAQLGMREGNGATERTWGNQVSGNYFDVLGVRAVHGRTFLPDEEERRAQVAVLNYGFWERRFAADTAIIGRTLNFNGQPFTVVGVAEPRFGGTIVGLNFDVFVPATTAAVLEDYGARMLEQRGWHTFDVIGRLRPGVTMTQAGDELQQIAVAAGQAGGDPDHRGALVQRFTDQGAPSWLRPVFTALLGVTGVVLLIACANVANLLLARAAGRRREIAIRLAVGANRRRLVRQLLTESFVMAGMAGLVGLLVAFWGRDLMMAFIPAAPFPIELDLAVDGRVLGFAVVATVLTAVLFGLVPAVQASRPALVPTLKDEIGGGAGRNRLQHGLVVGQLALSLISLVAAGLFIRSLASARSVDVGFHGPERVLLVGTDMTLAGLGGSDSSQVALSNALLADIRALPGVQSASLAMLVPLGFGGSSSSTAQVEGYQPQSDENMSLRFNVVGGDYFRTMGIEILQGRGITQEDVDQNAPVMVVNQRLVDRFWPGQNPIGRRITQNETEYTVVGVVPTGRYDQLTESPRTMLYRPYGLRSTPSAFTVHVRAAGDPVALTAAVRRAFEARSADLPFLDVRTMARHMQAAFFVQRIGAYMLAGFGCIALVLSAIGIYGVMNYGVSQRTREIGVRVALGAARSDVVGMVVGRAMRLAALGLAIGGVGAIGAGQLMRSQLLGISPRDPVTLVSIGGLLVVVAFVASWIPARRAARVDPMRALRYE